MPRHDLGVPSSLTPSTAYLGELEKEIAERARATPPLRSEFTGTSDERHRALLGEIVDEVAPELRRVAGALHEHPETAFAEHWGSQFLVDALLEHGIDAELGAHGLETAFRAEVAGGDGSGRTIAVLGEYDALPEIGHACGHNVIAATAVGAAIVLHRLAEHDPSAFDGRLVVLGTPAEEGHTGKEYMARAGAFEGLDAAMMVHPFSADVAHQTWLGRRVLSATYTGVPAHASAQPFMGRNALDAASLAYQGLGVLRQQVPPSDRVHAVISEGGTRASVIPSSARLDLYVRSAYPETLRDLSNRVEDVLRGAAVMAGVEVDVAWDHHPPSMPVRMNEALLGRWVASQHERGRAPHAPGVMPEVFAASTDFGNVSYGVPGIHPMLRIAEPDVALHTEAFAEAARSDAAHQAVVDGAYGLAATALDFLVDDALAAAVRQEFDDKGGAIDVTSYFT